MFIIRNTQKVKKERKKKKEKKKKLVLDNTKRAHILNEKQLSQKAVEMGKTLLDKAQTNCGKNEISST